MKSFGKTINLLAWFTERIDQFSAFLKKRFRLNDIKNIDRAVDSNSDAGDRYLGDQLRKIEDRAEQRKETT